MSWINKVPQFATFIDIGPGYVNSEAWAINKHNPQIKIFGFEPSPVRFAKIKGSFPGSIYEYAIGAANETQVMHLVRTMRPKRGDGIVRHIRGHQKNTSKKIEVVVRTLDSLHFDIGPFNQCFIWADIEGDELNMLRGATWLLEHNVVGLNLEVRPKENHPDRPSRKDITTFLKSYGFQKESVRSDCGTHQDILYIKKT
jgi:FkbM family methyltransferase